MAEAKPRTREGVYIRYVTDCESDLEQGIAKKTQQKGSVAQLVRAHP